MRISNTNAFVDTSAMYPLCYLMLLSALPSWLYPAEEQPSEGQVLKPAWLHLFDAALFSVCQLVFQDQPAS